MEYQNDPATRIHQMPASMSVRECVFKLHEQVADQMPCPEEHAAFLEEVERRRPRFVCEIGLHSGMTTSLFARVATDDAVLIGIELSRMVHPDFETYSRAQQKLIPVVGDAHDPAIVAEVKAYLAGYPLDLLYIDGEHTEKSIRQEIQDYGPCVRLGGMIAFHDAAYEAGKKVWEEFRQGKESYYFLESHPGYGIGMVIVGE